MLALKWDSTRGPCGSKTSPVWSSVTQVLLVPSSSHTFLPNSDINNFFSFFDVAVTNKCKLVYSDTYTGSQCQHYRHKTSQREMLSD